MSTKTNKAKTKTKTSKKKSNNVFDDKIEKESENDQKQKEQEELIDRLCIPFKKRNEFSNVNMYIMQSRQAFGSKRTLLSTLIEITRSNQRRNVHISDASFQKLMNHMINMCNQELFTSYENYDNQDYSWKLEYVDSLMCIINNLLGELGHRFSKFLLIYESDLISICLQQIQNGNANSRLKASRLAHPPIFLILYISSALKSNTTNIVSYREKAEHSMLILIVLLNHFLTMSNNLSRITEDCYQTWGDALKSCQWAMEYLSDGHHIIFGSKMFLLLQDVFKIACRLLYGYGVSNIFSQHAIDAHIVGITTFMQFFLLMKWSKATKVESITWIIDILSNEIIDNCTFLDILKVYQKKTRILHCNVSTDFINSMFNYLINKNVRIVGKVLEDTRKSAIECANQNGFYMSNAYQDKLEHCLRYYIDRLQVIDLENDVHQIKYSKKQCGNYPHCPTNGSMEHPTQKLDHTCSRCKKINYCSKTCALQDWDDHKKYCIKKK